ncbi:hypothetical protein C5F64_17265 [Photobacterium damselae subsp. damselae]|uniref:Uncharacterized protein n=1 Tax=Photobacterium damselae subsp. damselae TaxID=85581 RepID=A0A7Y7Q6G0_PHODD|nr:conjugative transfer protein MobI(A/C) [Photobacterium damselae]KAB1176634.1 hypothetical protein F6450_18110 [Photobacterium damselae subsp. damselae]NVO59005.1 hypothetical protein [Photobacterium damselae subsp. damselae]NVP00738.1 hypothetical protein [Photobacterium damselae subsp. damselae]PSB81633.1 hypothetical protein C5F64_17265 [Photobacterium damselae subsp. damselae]
MTEDSPQNTDNVMNSGLVPTAIQDALKALDKEYENIIFELEGIIDTYWIKWREKNKQLRVQRERSTTVVFNEGTIAPRLVTRNTKSYAEWVRYTPGRVGKKSKTWGTRINPKRLSNRKGMYYRIDQFEGIAKDWELELIAETEAKLSPLRYVAEYVYKAKSDTQQLIKSIVRKGS